VSASAGNNGQKLGHKYPLASGEVAIIQLIGKHPGLTATQFAALFWPGVKKVGRRNPARLAVHTLDKLRRKSLLFRRIEPTNYYRGGPVPPKVRYYLNAFGYAVYDYWKRQ